MSFQTVTMTLLDGFLLNIELFAVTLVLSLPLGLVVSFGTMSRFKPLSLLVRLYVYIMRSTPLMLQLAVVFYLPGIVFGPGHSLGRMGAAVLAFVLNYAAYFSEIFRGGIQGVPAGQREAGQVLGMTRSQIFFQVTLLQVVKRIVPPMGNEIITLVKDTSLSNFIMAPVLRRRFLPGVQRHCGPGPEPHREEAGLFPGLRGAHSMAILQVEDIQKRFGRTRVLEDISFSLEQGQAMAIIGSSGSGKTTLLRCLNFLEQPDRGRITVGGEVLFEIEEKGRTLLAQMGLADRAGHYPHQLSGGQQQRVAIARALALSPDILCFDEPTSALDPELTGEVLRVIRALAEQKTTMIIVTHEMAFARDVADQVVFMDGGVIVEQGDARQVIEHPREERTRQFLARYSEN